MTRQEKYPDHDYFHYFNANPRNRITGDCRIRAISVACEVPYNQVVMDFAKIQCETGYDQVTNQGIDLLLKQYGWVKMKQPRKLDNTKYRATEWCKYLKKHFLSNHDRIVANLGSHHVACIIDNKVWDIWDSSNECVGVYYIKNFK